MSKRIQVEQCAVLDIKQLPRIERSYTDEEFIRSQLYPNQRVQGTGPRRAELTLTFADGLRLRVTITVTRTCPNYGGTRQWFVCPGCERRVAKLYSPDPASDFKCRRCYRLVYRSQYEWLWRQGRYDVKKLVEREFDDLLAEAIRNDPAIKLCDDLLRNH